MNAVLCIYALAARGGGRIGRAGIAGERLRAIRSGAVEAIVGDIAKMPRPTATNLRRYDRVVSSLWVRSPALLPARFGTVVRDCAELELILGARQDTLRRQLNVVRNRTQMTVRILQGEGGRGQGLARGQESARGQASANTQPWLRTSDPRSPGRTYLQQRASTAHDVPEFGAMRHAVRRWVRAERVERRGNIVTVYHLVPRSAARAYRESIERAARDTQVRILVSGPWPAYAFADSW